MPRGKAVAVNNNFSRGLITEATGLSFPENAVTDTYNCEFDRTGFVSRRLGFDVEENYDGLGDDLTTGALTTYVWDNVASNADITLVVQQVGGELFFYDVDGSGNLSLNRRGGGVELQFTIPEGEASLYEASFANSNGVLIVTHRYADTLKVVYDVDTDTLQSSDLDIQVRDFDGDLADPNDVDERPASLSNAHEYNLRNQGWINYDTFFADLAVYPSNADVEWYFKDDTQVLDYIFGEANVLGGSSPAPKGHFIHSLVNIDRQNLGGLTNTVIADERFSTCCFFAGRMFYSGLHEQGYSSRIYFTQIIERDEQLNHAYQVNDPTSEKLFDLLPSDGGMIDIKDAGRIVKMFPLLNALLIFATNGVWSISGSQGIGFTANDHTIVKLSSIGVLSPSSFVDVEGIPYWWNNEGIYRMKTDPQTNSLRVESITDSTIKSFYADIPAVNKLYAKGVYDALHKKIQWVYRSTAPSGALSDDIIEQYYTFDRVLNFNLLTEAFYPWSNDSEEVFLKGIVMCPFIATGEDITMEDKVKFWVTYTEHSGSVSHTFAEVYDEDYLDWQTLLEDDAETYDSYFVSGYMVRGEGSRKQQHNYVSVFSDTSEVDSSFNITGQWDFSTDINTGRWSTVQTYSLEADGHAYKRVRPKIRGHGIACQFRISNNEDNPFFIIGWSSYDTANQMV